MQLFAAMLSDYFKDALVVSPRPMFSALPVPQGIRKWLGYIDQYIVFMIRTWFLVRGLPRDTLYVFSDQALGMWVPLVKRRPHVIHCHDFMALRSALGEYEENRPGLTGRIYQGLIRWGFSQGRNFISVSKATHDDLHAYARLNFDESVVIYNGLNYPYRPMTQPEQRDVLTRAGLPVEPQGMLMHIGGDQWYKNRAGVIELYAAYVALVEHPLPLWLIGPEDQPDVMEAIRKLPAGGVVKHFRNLEGPVLNAVYAQSRLLVFPSLSEGFGWPVAEAMAAGTLVLTTGQAPMTEVGGAAAFYHYRRRHESACQWAADGAKMIQDVLSLPEAQRLARLESGIKTAARFNRENALQEYRACYERVLEREA